MQAWWRNGRKRHRRAAIEPRCARYGSRFLPLSSGSDEFVPIGNGGTCGRHSEFHSRPFFLCSFFLSNHKRPRHVCTARTSVSYALSSGLSANLFLLDGGRCLLIILAARLDFPSGILHVDTHMTSAWCLLHVSHIQTARGSIDLQF